MPHSDDDSISSQEPKKKIFDYNKVKRQEKQTCRSKAENGENCRYEVKEGKNCCSKHADMEDYTDEMFENLKLCKHCPRPRWKFLGDGDKCQQCQDKRYCHAKQRSGIACRNKVVDGNKFCLRNHKYMENYTEEMLNNLKNCPGCHQNRYVGEFKKTNTQCNSCLERNAQNRKIAKEKAEKQ